MDVPLTEAGRAQCRALRPVLAGDPVGRRRRNTVQPHAREPRGDAPRPAADRRPRPRRHPPRLPRVAAARRVPRRGARRTASTRRRRAASRGSPRSSDMRVGCGGLAEETPHPALVVTHDQPIRYLLNVLARQRPDLGPGAAGPERDAVPVHRRDAGRGRPTPRRVARVTSRAWPLAPLPISRSSAPASARSTRPPHRDRGRDARRHDHRRRLRRRGARSLRRRDRA